MATFKCQVRPTSAAHKFCCAAIRRSTTHPRACSQHTQKQRKHPDRLSIYCQCQPVNDGGEGFGPQNFGVRAKGAHFDGNEPHQARPADQDYAAFITLPHISHRQILDLGFAYLSSSEIWRFAEGDLQALAAEVNESTSISVLDDHDIVYVMRVPTKHILKSALNVGSRVPAHAISMGRVQLAALPKRELKSYLASARLQAFTHWTILEPEKLRVAIERDRAQGWSEVYHELEEGISGLAVPIHAANGRVIAAANISAAPARIQEPGVRDYLLERLQRTTHVIEERLRTA